jgi:hypothetical protein
MRLGHGWQKSMPTGNRKILAVANVHQEIIPTEASFSRGILAPDQGYFGNVNYAICPLPPDLKGK